MKRISLTPPIMPDWAFHTEAMFVFDGELDDDISTAYEIADNLGWPIGTWDLSSMYDEHYFDDSSSHSRLNAL